MGRRLHWINWQRSGELEFLLTAATRPSSNGDLGDDRCPKSRGGGNRTPNRPLWRRLLCQLSYAPLARQSSLGGIDRQHNKDAGRIVSRSIFGADSRPAAGIRLTQGSSSPGRNRRCGRLRGWRNAGRRPWRPAFPEAVPRYSGRCRRACTFRLCCRRCCEAR